MTWYIRTLNTFGGVAYRTLDEAVAQVTSTVNNVHADKRKSRTEDGKIALHDADGNLVNTIWIEDENGRIMKF